MIKRIVVTGGAGFLGRHLCARLLQAGNTVIALDNLSSGSRENIAECMHHSRFTFIEYDVVTPYDIACDEIYNLACPASPPRYQASPIQTTKTSVLGMLNALESARKYNARVLQASTSEVYGDPLEHPQQESYWGHVNPIGIRSCYDEGKRCAESLCFDYARTYGVDVRVARIFNTYGPYMDPHDGRVVSNFIVQALAGKPLEVYGDGSQTRSFCYGDDLVEGLIRLMECLGPVRLPVNLGNPGEFTVLELAHRVIDRTRSSSTIIFKPLPSDDPIRRKPDISRAQTLLKWNPGVMLEEGLGRTIAYFRSQGMHQFFQTSHQGKEKAH